MLTVTPSAHAQINTILSEEEESKYVRAFIQGGGCSGFQYGFTMENDKNEDDFVIENLIVDAMSMQYFDGATIDYKTDKLQGSQFVISNPNAKTTCGCGSSFAV
jgi:iron-sulfur cluster insertion protein